MLDVTLARIDRDEQALFNIHTIWNSAQVNIEFEAYRSYVRHARGNGKLEYQLTEYIRIIIHGKNVSVSIRLPFGFSFDRFTR